MRFTRALRVVVLLSVCCAPAQRLNAALLPPQAPSSPRQKKEITDRAEHNAYITAMRESNAEGQTQAFEKFLQQYPNSVVKEDALEQLMAAYVKLDNMDKVGETAYRLLQVNGRNLPALAMLAHTLRLRAEASRLKAEEHQTNPQSASNWSQSMHRNSRNARMFAERGLKALPTATKPDWMSDADFERFKTQTSIICNGAIGFEALLSEDYSTAQQYLRTAVELRDQTTPSDPRNLPDVHSLALSYLEITPKNPLGLWYIARALVLGKNDPKILKYGQAMYTTSRGSLEGWDQLVEEARNNPASVIAFNNFQRPGPTSPAGNSMAAGPKEGSAQLPGPGPQRGMRAVEAQPAGVLAKRGPYYALVIGINDYRYLPKLKTAINDATAIADVLHKTYGFETKLLKNATRRDILTALSEYERNVPEDANLLIYYAGHGHFYPGTDKAYWLPADAERETKADWIIADDITSGVKAIPAKHILIVSDSCYSGGITRDVDLRNTPRDRDRYIQKMIASKSRTLMSSGGNEPVADGGGGGHSVFANAILHGLEQMDGDVFTAEELFHTSIRISVAGRSEQTPQYNPIRNSGHDDGDFVFDRRNPPAK